MTQNSKLVQSLVDFGVDFGVDVLALPIHTFDYNAPWPAFTTEDGIYVHKKVLVREPQNLKIYLAHELMHHVVEDKEHMYMYTHKQCNYAEDYKINQLLYEIAKYDVRKVKNRGLFSTKFNSMTVPEIAKYLAAHSPPSQGGCCGATGIAHPLILAAAHRLRIRYADKLQRKTEDHFFVDLVDRSKFYKVLPKLGASWKLHHLPFIAPAKTMLGIWSHLFLESAVAAPLDHKRLTPSESVAFSMNTRLLRAKTVGNPDEAILAASIYLQNIDRDESYLRNLADKIAHRIVVLQEKRRRTKKLRVRLELFERIKQLRVKLRDVKRLVPISKMLKESRLPKVKPASKIPTSTTVSLRSAHSKNKMIGQVKLPNFDRKNPIVKRLASAARRSVRDLAETIETFKKLQHQMPELTNMPEEPPEEKQKDVPPKEQPSEDPDDETKAEGEEASEDTDEDETTNDGEEGEESEDAEESEEGETTEESSNDGTNDEDAEGDDYDEQDPTIPEDSESTSAEVAAEEPIQQDGDGKAMGGKSSSKSESAGGTRIELMQLVFMHKHYLSRIVSRVQEIQAQLKSSPSRDSDPDGLVPVSLSYGNDLENVLQSELALLSSKETEMEFLVRYANHSLLVSTPAKSKRSPVVFCVDGSGSMHGAFYITAVAFTLAMMLQLYRDGRGCALVLFSSTVDKVFVLNPGIPVDFKVFLETLCSPAFGGTSFDAALLKAFEIKEQEEWKDFTAMLVSDGYDSISPATAEFLKTKKSSNDKIIAVITSDLTEITHVDEIHHVKRKNAELELINVGNAIL